ncbi:hypothetical protein BDV93DRAFT_508576 [Ceratobasidium sp. AG-I]|nr:hypothetical protein BDV93DRAFT_508576 [Ceratobasidium sp. AG-I]
MSAAPVFSTVMWAPSDKQGPLVTRRRGSATASYPTRAQPRRGSVDARTRCMATAKPTAAPLPPPCLQIPTASTAFGLRVLPEPRAAKSVRWEDYKFPGAEAEIAHPRMPVPVSTPAVSAKFSKSERKYQSPPECRPFRLLDLPVYHPEDVRTELNGRLVKTLNDVVPLGQSYPVLSPACAHIQYELLSIGHDLANISVTRLTYIADALPDVLRRIRRLANNVLAISATQYEADRLQALADTVRQIRKARV